MSKPYIISDDLTVYYGGGVVLLDTPQDKQMISYESFIHCMSMLVHREMLHGLDGEGI